jgi:hypothetical protein
LAVSWKVESGGDARKIIWKHLLAFSEVAPHCPQSHNAHYVPVLGNEYI